eukprot:1292492-Amorphochlora_amoeboformis.AAC.1
MKNDKEKGEKHTEEDASNGGESGGRIQDGVHFNKNELLANEHTKGMQRTILKCAEAYLDTEAYVAPTKSAAQVSGASKGSVPACVATVINKHLS